MFNNNLLPNTIPFLLNYLMMMPSTFGKQIQQRKSSIPQVTSEDKENKTARDVRLVGLLVVLGDASQQAVGDVLRPLEQAPDQFIAVDLKHAESQDLKGRGRGSVTGGGRMTWNK